MSFANLPQKSDHFVTHPWNGRRYSSLNDDGDVNKFSGERVKVVRLVGQILIELTAFGQLLRACVCVPICCFLRFDGDALCALVNIRERERERVLRVFVSLLCNMRCTCLTYKLMWGTIPFLNLYLLSAYQLS